MSGDIIPNSFQNPNVMVDEYMPYLTGEEWKVLSYAMRHILGFVDRIASRKCRMSVTMFEKGYGPYPGCGLSRPAVIKALDGLAVFCLMNKCWKLDEQGVRVLDINEDGQLWELAYDKATIRFDLLQARDTEKRAKATKRTDKARQTKAAGKSDLPAEVVSGTNQERSVPLTGGGKSDLLNQTHLQTHLQTQDSAPSGTDTNSDASVTPVTTTIQELADAVVEEAIASSGDPMPTPPVGDDPPPTRERDPLFDAVTLHIFETDPLQVNGEGGRIGRISSWLAGKSDGVNYGRRKEIVGFISSPAEPKHVQMFAEHWKVENPGASLPLDFIKFVEAWRKWGSSRKQKSVSPAWQPATKSEQPPSEPLTLTSDELQANRTRRRQIADGIAEI